MSFYPRQGTLNRTFSSRKDRDAAVAKDIAAQKHAAGIEGEKRRYKSDLERWSNYPHSIEPWFDLHYDQDKVNGYALLRLAVKHHKSRIFHALVYPVLPKDILLYCLDDETVWDRILLTTTPYDAENFINKHPDVYEFIELMRTLDPTAEAALATYRSTMLNVVEGADLGETSTLPTTLTQE